MKRVLIADDEKPVSDIIGFNLTEEGYGTVTAFDGREAITKLEGGDPDLIILDLILPELDGLEVAKEVRKISHIPIIMLSAKDGEFDKAIVLGIGANDYVTKPFSNRESLARVEVHFHRIENIEATVAEENVSASSLEVAIGDLKVLSDVFVAQKRGEDIKLTHREFRLLHHSVTHMGQVMTHEYLLETAWGYDYFDDIRMVDAAIRRSREKVEDTPSRPEYILTRRGVGYYVKSYE